MLPGHRSAGGEGNEAVDDCGIRGCRGYAFQVLLGGRDRWASVIDCCRLSDGFPQSGRAEVEHDPR